MDDGGIPYLETVPWLDQGLLVVSSVRSGEIRDGEWGRDCWGANLNLDRVRIYSHYDENYFVDMNIDNFESALSEWKEFILSGCPST